MRFGSSGTNTSEEGMERSAIVLSSVKQYWIEAS